MKSNNIRRIVLSSVSIVLLAIVVGCTNEKKEETIAPSLVTSTTSINSSNLSIPAPSTPSSTEPASAAASTASRADAQLTPTKIEEELTAELEEIMKDTETTPSISSSTEQTSNPQTPNSTTQPSGSTEQPSSSTEQTQPTNPTEGNTAASQPSASTNTGGSPVNVGDPGYNPNYISPVTGVVLDQNHNSIPDPLEIGTGSKVVSDDWSNYDWH